MVVLMVGPLPIKRGGRTWRSHTGRGSYLKEGVGRGIMMSSGTRDKECSTLSAICLVQLRTSLIGLTLSLMPCCAALCLSLLFFQAHYVKFNERGLFDLAEFYCIIQ